MIPETSYDLYPNTEFTLSSLNLYSHIPNAYATYAKINFTYAGYASNTYYVSFDDSGLLKTSSLASTATVSDSIVAGHVFLTPTFKMDYATLNNYISNQYTGTVSITVQYGFLSYADIGLILSDRYSLLQYI